MHHYVPQKKTFQVSTKLLLWNDQGWFYIISHIYPRSYYTHERNNGAKPEKITFYIYPLGLFPSFWGPNSTCDNSKPLTPKHDGYIHALQAMKRHPWRVSDPHEAKLALLPISIDVYSRGGCPGLKEDTILEELKDVIEQSTIFPNIRHVFIGVDWMTKKLGKKILSLLKPAGIWAAMEDRGDCQTSLPYDTNYANLMSMRAPNSWHLPSPPVFGSERIYTINFVGQFDERDVYKERVALFTSSKSHNISKPFIVAPTQEVDHGSMIKKGFPLRFCQSHLDTDRCISKDDFPSRIETQSSLERSNFTLLLRGDTPGGDRWFQAMAAGTALIQVIESERTWDWLPFPCAIPWKEMVLSIPRHKFMQDPMKSVNDLLSSVTEERLLELQHLSLHYAADIDWTAHNSRVLENFLKESLHIRCSSFEEKSCLRGTKLHEKKLCIPPSRLEHDSKVLQC